MFIFCKVQYWFDEKHRSALAMKLLTSISGMSCGESLTQVEKSVSLSIRSRVRINVHNKYWNRRRDSEKSSNVGLEGRNWINKRQHWNVFPFCVSLKFESFEFFFIWHRKFHFYLWICWRIFSEKLKFLRLNSSPRSFACYTFWRTRMYVEC